jgi:hypothetical protein
MAYSKESKRAASRYCRGGNPDFFLEQTVKKFQVGISDGGGNIPYGEEAIPLDSLILHIKFSFQLKDIRHNLSNHVTIDYESI